MEIRNMKTTKQHKLVQERANLLEKNEQLKAELQVLIDKSNYDNDHYTFSDDERGEQISSEITINARKMEAINRKLEMYEVIDDCFDAFYKRLKKEFDINPNNKVVIRGKDLLDEFKRADEAKKYEVKRKKQ